MSDVFPMPGISGLSFDSTLLSPLMFCCLLPSLFLSSFYLFCPLANSPDFFFQKILQYFHEEIVFWVALVQQLGDDSWSVVCAVCCHMALAFAARHLYNILKFLLLLSIPFFKFFLNTLKKKMV